MKWRRDLGDDWDAAPDDPPAVDRGAKAEPLANGVVVRDRADGDAYLYSDVVGDDVDGVGDVSDPR